MTLPQLGVCLPQFLDDPAVTLSAAEDAERLGYASVSLFDHLQPIGAPDRPILECLTMLAAVAVRTERVRVLPLVARAGLRPPAITAHVIASLDRLAPGRVVLGLGAGDSLSAPEDRSIGLPPTTAAQRLARLRETVRRARELAPGVPVWVGGTSPAVRRVAGELADGWNVWAARPDEVSAGVQTVLEASGGRARTITWGGQVVVARSADEARERFSRWALDRPEGERARVLHGDVAAVGARLAELAAAGAEECFLSFVGGDSTGQRRLLASLL